MSFSGFFDYRNSYLIFISLFRLYKNTMVFRLSYAVRKFGICYAFSVNKLLWMKGAFKKCMVLLSVCYS